MARENLNSEKIVFAAGFGGDKNVRPTQLLTRSAASQQQSESQAGNSSAQQFFAVMDGHKTGPLVANFDHADWNRAYASASAATFAASAGVADPARPGARAVAVGDSCHRDDGLAIGGDRFAVNCLYAGLVENAVTQGLKHG